IPGNHDEALREYDNTAFGDIQVVNEYVHVLADGRRFLLVHGDEFDQVTRYHKWVAVLGDMAYNWLVRLNAWLSWCRRRLNRPGYWSLAGYAKRKVKTAVSFIFDFEDSVIHAARERGMDGVVCGHIHQAALREVDGLTYVNCGDWVDSCTAIVEHLDGRLELVEQGSHRLALPAPTVPAPKGEAQPLVA
ncbi:MAG: UDP-2,3-diacylglucosamine diphosphatase, partial [Rhodocyclaceae bacterium]